MTGGAGLMGLLSTFGGGYLAAGGLGIKGGAVVITILGLSGGIMFTDYSDPQCRDDTYNLLKYKIHYQHPDSYYYPNGKIAYDGMFLNNLPHGNGVVYDEHGEQMYSGLFNRGVPRICTTVW